jgi:signal peptidase I
MPKASVRPIISCIAAALIIIFVTVRISVHNFRVVGSSMANNLQDGQYLLVNKLAYTSFLFFKLGRPQRGDVIVFTPPGHSEDYVKRVIGLPGDKIQILEGVVLINDELAAEPFEPVPGSYTMFVPAVIHEGHLFVLGDNRDHSNDSHNWGPVPLENVIGKVWLSYWPPDRLGNIPRDAPARAGRLKIGGVCLKDE